MIYVSEDQLEQVEYLIEQSIQGNHVLFGNDTVSRILRDDRFACVSPSDEQAYSVEHHIERMILQPTLEEKRAYLERLDPNTFESVVRTYFNIIENNIFENQEVRH